MSAGIIDINSKNAALDSERRLNENHQLIRH